MSDLFNQNLEAYNSARESIANQVDQIKEAYRVANEKTTTTQKVGQGLAQIGGTTGGLIGTYVGVKHLLTALGSKATAKGAETKSEEEVAEDNAEGAEAGEEGEEAAEGPMEEMTTFREPYEAEEINEADLPTEGIEEVEMPEIGEGVTETTFGSEAATATLPADISTPSAVMGNTATANITNASLSTPSDAAATGAQDAIAAADPEGASAAVSAGTTASEAAVEGSTGAAVGSETAVDTAIVSGGAAAAPETLGLSLVGAAIVAGITSLIGTLTSEFGGKKHKKPPTPDVMTVGPNMSHDPEGNVAQGIAF